VRGLDFLPGRHCFLQSGVLMDTYITLLLLDRSLNEVVTDKIRKYRSDQNNNPLNTISFMSAIPRTSGRLHSEFVCLLFLQDHRGTDRFFTDLGVQRVQHDRDQFHYRRASFSSQFKSKIGNILRMIKSVTFCG
jgi:hypothetical protein